MPYKTKFISESDIAQAARHAVVNAATQGLSGLDKIATNVVKALVAADKELTGTSRNTSASRNAKR